MRVGQEGARKTLGGGAPPPPAGGKTEGAAVFGFGDAKSIRSHVDDGFFVFHQLHNVASACFPFSLQRLLATTPHRPSPVPREQGCSSDLSQGPLVGRLELRQLSPSDTRSRLGSSRLGDARREQGGWGPRAWVRVLSYSSGDCGRVASAPSPGLLIWEMIQQCWPRRDNAHDQLVD